MKKFAIYENILLVEFKTILQIYENIRYYCISIYENTYTLEFEIARVANDEILNIYCDANINDNGYEI